MGVNMNGRPRPRLGRLHSSRYGYLVALLMLVGCNALDQPGTDADSKRIVPTDSRAVRVAPHPPPPIQGGTLAIDPEGEFAIASDPDRDRISIVHLATRDVAHVVLEPGDQPGRVAVDDRGQAHVALRGSGDLVTIGLVEGEVRARRRACAAPRGVAYDAHEDAVRVACVEGNLVSLPAGTEGTGVSSSLAQELPEGLRDVVVRPDGSLAVSRFKRAEVLSVVDGALAARSVPGPLVRGGRFNHRTGEIENSTHTPHLAWRMVNVDVSAPPGVNADSGFVMLHQSARNEEVDIGRGADGSGGADGEASYGGGDLGCEGIVSTAVTWLRSGDTPRTVTVMGAVLAVDVAVKDGLVALAQAGTSDPDAPKPFVVRDEGVPAPVFDGPISFQEMPSGPANILLMPLDRLRTGSSQAACVSPRGQTVAGQVTAVAFTPRGDLIAQSREPAKLVVLRPHGVHEQATFRFEIPLGGGSVADTGHDLFHRDSGAGIACASCHAEGGDDGHTWRFSGLGVRRTQAMHVGLEGTAPFHWDGDLPDLGSLMTEVFVGRMGGVHQSAERLDALAAWLFSLRPPTPMVEPGSPSAQRGKALFESEALGCADCHTGARLTDNRSYHVGTTDPGHLLQVPSLRGIGYRAPFLHTGCAPTLDARFDPGCGGGDLHGRTSHLRASEVSDLVAYLKSL